MKRKWRTYFHFYRLSTFSQISVRLEHLRLVNFFFCASGRSLFLFIGNVPVENAKCKQYACSRQCKQCTLVNWNVNCRLSWCQFSVCCVGMLLKYLLANYNLPDVFFSMSFSLLGTFPILYQCNVKVADQRRTWRKYPITCQYLYTPI